MKFFTVKQLLFIIVLVSAVLTRWLDLPAHWQGHGSCLVLQPAATVHLLGRIALLALC